MVEVDVNINRVWCSLAFHHHDTVFFFPFKMIEVDVKMSKFGIWCSLAPHHTFFFLRIGFLLMQVKVRFEEPEYVVPWYPFNMIIAILC